jgi:Tfp pilus assembly protein PilX
MIALVVLVAMTLAGIALVRSVDSTNIIAGNLAFQQAATHSGDSGIEAAIGWLETNAANTSGTYLQSSHNSGGDCNGYASNRSDPGQNVSWASWWNSLGGCQKVALTPDAAGNIVSYTIHRMCQTSGKPATANCSASTTSVAGGFKCQTSGCIDLKYTGQGDQVYYRITSRIDGPRGAVSYVQVIVAM